MKVKFRVLGDGGIVLIRRGERGIKLRTAKSVFSERSLKVVCFLQRSWYTCNNSSGL